MKLSWDGLDGREKVRVRAACAVVLLYAAVTHLGAVWSAVRTVLGFFAPVIIGLFLALFLSPVADYIRRLLFRKTAPERVAETVSVVVTVLLLLLGIALLMGALLPQLAGSSLALAENLDAYAANLQKLLSRLGLPADDTEPLFSEIIRDGGLLSSAVSWLTANLGRLLQVSAGIRRGAFNWGIGSVLAIYILLARRRLRAGLGRLLRLILSEEAYRRTVRLGRRFDAIFARYILCELVDALIVGGVNYGFMKLTGMPYALLISAAVGVTNLAPTFGPIAGAAVGAFILLLVRPVLALWFLLFTVALQTVDGYFIKPKMFGDVLNVPGLLILVSIVVGGGMFGVAGLLLAIPAAAIIEYLCHELLIPRLEEEKRMKEARHGAAGPE